MLPYCSRLRLRTNFPGPPEFPNRFFFRRGARGAGTHHLHVFEDNSVEWSCMIAFRDFLRTNPENIIGSNRKHPRFETELSENKGSLKTTLRENVTTLD
jgi:GrpB-like predicted nucleotidyltransferase (UPF0157 family)